MLHLNIPGYKDLRLEHLVLDFNGTLACDGQLIPGVKQLLEALAPKLHLHLLTADTFGSVKEQVAGLPVSLHVIAPGREAQAKADYLQALGPEKTAAIGNGRNDGLMLQQAALGVAVLQSEGLAVEALLAAHVITPGILEALELLLYPQRLQATLRW